MKRSKSDFQLEQLEPRLLLSASPLLPQAMTAAAFQSESPVAVQGLEAGQQASIDLHTSFTYNPAANVSDLFARGPAEGSAAQAAPPAAPAGSSAAVQAVRPETTAAAFGASLAQPVVSSNTGLAVNNGAGATPSPSQSSMTDQRTETLSSAQPPPPAAEQTLTYTAGPHGSDVTLRLNPEDPGTLQIVDDGSGAVVASSPLSAVGAVHVSGANNADNTLTVDLSVPFWLKGGVVFDGGTGGYNTLAVIGPKGGSVSYTAMGTAPG